MRKFLILIQKELKELLTPQMLLPFILVVGVMYAFSQFATQQAEKAKGPVELAVVNQDASALSDSLVNDLSQNGFDIKLLPPDTADVPQTLRQKDYLIGITIPVGFSASVDKFAPEPITTYSNVPSFSVTSASKYVNLDKAVAIINASVSNKYLTEKVPGSNPALLKNPVQTTSYTIVKDRSVVANVGQVLTYLASQAYFVPIILFLVIVLASQIIATSIASEKENKTLEILLTAPLSRRSVVAAKMISAGIVGLLLAGIYLIGFRSLINSGGSGASSVELSTVLKSLGLVLAPQSYLLLGAVVFLGILLALAIAIILGAFAEDVKSVQGVIAPLLVLMMIPYFAVLLLDLNALPTVVKYIIYAIPFSHVFMALPNLYLHNTSLVIYGGLYELVVLVIFIWLAGWIFSTDKIMTMRLNFSKRKKLFR